MSPQRPERTGGRRPLCRAALAGLPADLSRYRLQLADNEEAAGPDEQQEDDQRLIQGVLYLASHAMLILQCANTEESPGAALVGSLQSPTSKRSEKRAGLSERLIADPMPTRAVAPIPTTSARQAPDCFPPAVLLGPPAPPSARLRSVPEPE